MATSKILNLLGLAKRAGKIIDGEGRVLSSFKSEKSMLIFLASDTGENIKKKILDKARFYQVEVNQTYTTDELSRAIGKNNRKVLALIDKNFIDLIAKN
ncbi:MAG: L7Ae/L30e/S12e/Gadd45 family ribosomal protein [Candidatus Izemoplasmataceae bacterium]